MDFEAFVSDIRNNNWNVFGVEVYEQGILTHTYGDTCDGIYDIYSATKSILSLATGIVYDMGLIDLHKPVICYLPGEYVDKMSDKQKADYEYISVERLLTMSVDGYPFRPEGADFLDFSLGCELTNPSERIFCYSNINAYLVGVALEHVLKEELGRFIETHIFEPLNITEYEYEKSPEGYFYGASKMKLTVNGLSKIGMVFYDKGVYEDKRIVSEEYVHLATSVRQMNREGGYGYFIWKYRDGFSINGKWKQKCYCLPGQGIMVTYLSHIEDDCMLKESMEKHILDCI